MGAEGRACSVSACCKGRAGALAAEPPCSAQSSVREQAQRSEHGKSLQHIRPGELLYLSAAPTEALVLGCYVLILT